MRAAAGTSSLTPGVADNAEDMRRPTMCPDFNGPLLRSPC